MSFRNDDTSGDAERPSGIPTVNPWAARPAEPPAPPQPPLPEPPHSKWFNWPSVAFAVVIFGGIGAQAYQELSKPEAWAYWKDLYVSPSMSSSEVGSLDPDNSGRGRPALAITGEIGPATASWFREKLDDAKLAPGDTVLLSSPGGNVGQAIIMGEIIRARGLTTAVGTVDSAGRIKPSYCASACVMTYAGGKARIGVEGSRLGVHRFVSPKPGADPTASAQRTMGYVLSYMTKMGVASSVVEAMSATEKIRWLGTSEAAAMNLVTDPARKS
ncbi:hypothetical protein AB7828_23420 [Tardiphaga sp. 215_C5_N2_1]|uniref:hypothetical protein n=1 Tax=Tardiphaga sp. 215_C5_N2_1 TaxID=3240774 RepID=UPI003F8BF690